MIDNKLRPVCGCGAGFCRSEVVTTGGPNFGRKFYVCPIKKGQGACNYFMWQDADSSVAAPASGLRSDENIIISPVSTLTNSINISPSDNDIVEESQPINVGQQENTSQSSSNIVSPKSSLLKRNNLRLGELKGSEDISDGEPLIRHSKKLRQLGDSETDGFPSASSSVSQMFVPLENLRNCLTVASSPTVLGMEFHHGQMASWKHSHTEEETTTYESFLSSCCNSSTLLIDYEILRDTCWALAAVREDLRQQIQGWWGRLAFPPSKCLIEPPHKPFFCCIFPSFDPIFVPTNVYLLNEAARVAEPVCSTQEPQGKNSIMMKFVSKAFIEAAKQLQSDLLNILKSLDMKDYEIMSQEANAAFNALDRLGTDHEKFREQVQAFILSASLLAKIDQSISSSNSCQELNDRFNRQKLKLDEIKESHAKVVDALSASAQRAAYLTEKISHLKDELRGTEAELCCCKAESAALEARTSQMAKDKVKCERSLEKTWNGLKKLKEMEAAKTAYEKAKVLLFGDFS